MDRDEGQDMSGQGAAPTPPLKRGISRREAVNYSLVALASAALGGSAVWLARRSVHDAATTGLLEIFKKDAPTGELWEAWKRRGWDSQGGKGRSQVQDKSGNPKCQPFVVDKYWTLPVGKHFVDSGDRSGHRTVKCAGNTQGGNDLRPPGMG